MLRKLTSILTLFLLVTIFMFAEGIEAQIVTDGLISYWPLDEETIDGDIVEDVWGENDGTINGSPKMVDGKIGDALEFSGAGFVDIEGTDSLNLNGKEQLTASAWVNVQGHSGSCCDPIVAQRDVSGWALRYDNRNAGAEIEFIVHNPSWVGDGADFGAPVPKEGEWHLMTGVLNGSELLIYIDDELISSIAFAGTIISTGTETEIGGALDGNFMGIIDEVLIYEKGLTEEEVKRNYKSEGLAVNPSDNKLAQLWGTIKVSR